MQKVRGRSSSPTFTAPPGIVMASVDWDTGHRVCGGDGAIGEAFRADSEPQQCDSIGEIPIARHIGRWVRGLFQ